MKKKFLVVLLLAMFIFPINVNAFSGKVILTCDDEVIKANDTLNCLISGNSFSAPISSFHGKILLGDGLSLVNFTKDSSWEGSGNGGIIDLYTGVNKTGKINFGSFVVKSDKNINGSVNIKIEDINVSDDNFKVYNLSVVSKKITVSNNDSNNVIVDNSSNNELLVDDDKVYNKITEDNNEEEVDINISLKDDDLVKDSNSKNIWIAIVSLIGTIFFICIVIYLCKKGRNV